MLVLPLLNGPLSYQAEECLRLEEERVDNYLHASTKAKLLNQVCLSSLGCCFLLMPLCDSLPWPGMVCKWTARFDWMTQQYLHESHCLHALLWLGQQGSC
jgi:hypothetical protein